MYTFVVVQTFGNGFGQMIPDVEVIAHYKNVNDANKCLEELVSKNPEDRFKVLVVGKAK